ncbi:GNAT family N-acetyltransferase [Gracilibacillus oryzae]|uniref:GNAT family N-acetyltransferase n=1 Tax=Gracilibacillus oryzae TaxID=1672701 RepID=A0A7C8KMC9_9BACI|nr:GNAT family N-acetyltransferase [Gracilibacillus oryzae]KAB8125974.1 GNAT family N-acetyltransferase [Gracilibacillus oryzae]
MQINQLTPKDAAKYRRLRLDALHNSPTAFAASYDEEEKLTITKYKQLLDTPNSWTFGVFVDTSLVGMITLIRESLIKLYHRAKIMAFYIQSAYQGEGYGRQLIEKALQHAEQLAGLEQIYLSVAATNERAKKLYTSLGFNVYAYEKNALKFQGTYYDEEQMVLFLDSNK